LKASVLCAASGTTPDFNPPVYEKTDLSFQPHGPKKEVGKMFQHRKWPHQHRRTKSTLRSSWSTTSSTMSTADSSDDGICFKKQPIKSISTNSLLTSEVTSSQNKTKGQQGAISTSQFAEMMKKEMVSVSMLPSAFDSDSEDEDED
jgi:hypothetical protein